MCDYICQIAAADETLNGISWERARALEYTRAGVYTEDLDSFELFSGCCKLTAEFRQIPNLLRARLHLCCEVKLAASRHFLRSRVCHVKPRQWYDLLHRGSDNDICGVSGFLLALRDTLRLRVGGLLWAGHPCNPQPGFRPLPSCDPNSWCVVCQALGFLRFVWISMGTHWRHVSILGDDRALTCLGWARAFAFRSLVSGLRVSLLIVSGWWLGAVPGPPGGQWWLFGSFCSVCLTWLCSWTPWPAI